jgi:excisionase family DNA binding protein
MSERVVLVTTAGAARILNVSVARVHQLVRSGELRATRTESRQLLFVRAAVERVAEERARRRPGPTEPVTATGPTELHTAPIDGEDARDT